MKQQIEEAATAFANEYNVSKQNNEWQALYKGYLNGATDFTWPPKASNTSLEDVRELFSNYWVETGGDYYRSGKQIWDFFAPHLQTKPADERRKGGYNFDDLVNLLEDVVNELDLSELAIEKHGPLGTPPAELVKLVLEQKNLQIRALKSGMKEVELKPVVDTEELLIKFEEEWDKKFRWMPTEPKDIFDWFKNNIKSFIEFPTDVPKELIERFTNWSKDNYPASIYEDGNHAIEDICKCFLANLQPSSSVTPKDEAVDPVAFLNWKERSGYVFVESKRSEAFVNKSHGILVNGSDYHYQKLIDEHGKTLTDLLDEYKTLLSNNK